MDGLKRVLQDAVDEACAAGADIVHDDHARWSPQQHRIWVRLSGDGRGGVSFERLRHWSEGYSSLSRKVDVLKPEGGIRFRRMIHEEISAVAGLQARDAVSTAISGSRYSPCASTFSCHPVGRALALHVGHRPADMGRPLMERAGDEDRARQDTHDVYTTALRIIGLIVLYLS